MTGKYINNANYYEDGYTLTGTYSSITIGPDAVVGGISGIRGRANEAYTIVNAGRIEGPERGPPRSIHNVGIVLFDGGIVTNRVGGLIEGLGDSGVVITGASGTVANYGKIYGFAVTPKESYSGVALADGGTVINGASAVVGGSVGVYISGGIGSVINSGGIWSIRMRAGGAVSNGAGASSGEVEIQGGYGSVNNDGRIQGSVILGAGGAVTNGAAGYLGGVVIQNGSGTINDAGRIEGSCTLADGGILNIATGAAIDENGFGYVSISGAAGTITNAGSINIKKISFNTGVIINDEAREIQVTSGIVDQGAGTVTNAGTILCTGGMGSAVSVLDGGKVTNTGSGAFIEATGLAGIGVSLILGGTLINPALVESTGYKGVGVSLKSGNVLSNSGGTILATGIQGIAVAVANDSLAASGKIDVTGSDAIGIDVGSGSNVSNAAIVEATGSDGIGVKLTATGSVTNAAFIEATGHGGIGVDVVAAGIVNNMPRQFVTGYAIGVKLQSKGTLSNAGTVNATGKLGIAVDLTGGGRVTNIGGGLIEASASGAMGIEFGAGSTIVNGKGGTILGTDAGIDGVYSGSAAPTLISNAGTIRATTAAANSFAIILTGDATLANVGATALIVGHDGIETGFGSFSDTITNGGKIEGTGGLDAQGVLLKVAGVVVNNAHALISGSIGIEAGDGQASITNAGTISAFGSTGDGITLGGQGFVTNSAGGLITGRLSGVAVTLGDSSLSNTGTIIGGTYGVTLDGQGFVTNGKGGLIEGAVGIATSSGTIANAGTIEGLAGYAGIYFKAAGVVTNAAGGMIAGTNGIEALSLATIGNAGTIAARDGVGAYLVRGLVTNTGTSSLIEGNEGLAVAGRGTVVNFGTIASTSGADGAAVLFQSGLDVLVDEAGSRIIGRVTGGGGTIELVGNGGTLSGFGTQFKGFGYMELLAGTSWVFGGNNLIGANILNDGTLSDPNSLITVVGDVSGTGRVTIGATATLYIEGTVAASQTIAFAGATGGTLLLDDPSGGGFGFAGAVSGFGGTDRLDLESFAFSGGPKLAWAQSGAKGTLTVTDGSDVARITLFGQYAAAGFKAAKDTAGGTVVTYTTQPAQVALASPHH